MRLWCVNEGGGDRVEIDERRCHLCSPRREDLVALSSFASAAQRPRADAGHRRQRARCGAGDRASRRSARPRSAGPRDEGFLRGARRTRSTIRQPLSALRSPPPPLRSSSPCCAPPSRRPRSRLRDSATSSRPLRRDRRLPAPAGSDAGRPRAACREALGAEAYELEWLSEPGGTRSPLHTPLWSAIESFVVDEEDGAALVRSCSPASPTATSCARRSARSSTASSRCGHGRRARRGLVHSADERVAVEDLELGTRFLIRLALPKLAWDEPRRRSAWAGWRSRTACSCTARATGRAPCGRRTASSTVACGREDDPLGRRHVADSCAGRRGRRGLARAAGVRARCPRHGFRFSRPQCDRRDARDDDRGALAPLERPEPPLQELAAARSRSCPRCSRCASSELAAYHGAEHISIGSYEHGELRPRGARAVRHAPPRASPGHDCSRQRRLPAERPQQSNRPRTSPRRSARSPPPPRSSAGWFVIPTTRWRALARPGQELQDAVATAEPTPEQVEVAHAALRRMPRARAARCRGPGGSRRRRSVGSPRGHPRDPSRRHGRSSFRRGGRDLPARLRGRGRASRPARGSGNRWRPTSTR